MADTNTMHNDDAEDRCDVCHEEIDYSGNSQEEIAEMWDPRATHPVALFCHVTCGLSKGYAIA